MSLFEAIEHHDSAEVQRLLLISSTDVNSRNEKNQTPLMRACELGLTAIVKSLLAHEKTEISAIIEQSAYGLTALRYAMNADQNGSHQEIIDLIVSYAGKLAIRADDKRISRLSYNDEQLAMLYYAKIGNREKVRECLDEEGIHKCDINFIDGEHETVFTNAARYGHLQLVRDLLANSELELNQTTGLNETALILAAYEGKEEIVDLLLAQRNIDLHVQGYLLGTALTVAIYREHYGIAWKLLIAEKSKEGLDLKHPGAMLCAVRNNNAEMVRMLIASGANVNVVGSEGCITPPQQVWEEEGDSPFAYNGPPVFDLPICVALRKNRLNVLPALLDAGADLTLEGTWGASALRMVSGRSVSLEAKTIIECHMAKQRSRMPVSFESNGTPTLFTPRPHSPSCRTETDKTAPRPPDGISTM